MDSRLVLGLLAGPTVLCIGTTKEQFAALAEASDGSMLMLYLPDLDSALRLLAGDAGVSAIPDSAEGRLGGRAGRAGWAGLSGLPEAESPGHGRPATRGAPAEAPVRRIVEHGTLRLDADRREATWQGRRLPLSAREFDLLYALCCDPGRVWTFAELTTHVWSRPYLGDTDAVVSAVKRLRRQMRLATGSVIVESVRGVGYRVVVSDDGPRLSRAEG